MKAQMISAIAKNGGWVNCHAHFDKAFYVTREGLDKANLDMERKWLMSDDLKRQSIQEEIEDRIRTGLDILIEQGCKATCSFVDAYDAVGHKAIDAANNVEKEYKDKIDFVTVSQPLGGINDDAARDLYAAITAKADIAGGLPSRDRPDDDQSYDHLFRIAKALDKPLHVHIDQENNPDERDMEKLLNAVEQHGYEGRVAAIHGISASGWWCVRPPRSACVSSTTR